MIAIRSVIAVPTPTAMVWCRQSCSRRFALSRQQALFTTKSDTDNCHLRAATSEDANALKELLCDESVITTVADQPSLSRDWTKQYHASPETILLQPTTVAQIASLLKYCSQHGIGVVTVAGNTGLTGGGMPTKNNEILLSLRRLHNIHEFTPAGVVRADAGCVVQSLQDYCAEYNHLLPLDFGSKGSCTVGGCVSTNAGGSYFYRYGSVAANLVGLQAVTADGAVLDLNFTKALLKDNTGYKLHQFLVGSEGTLAVITGVALKCHALNTNKQTVLLKLHNFTQVIDAVTIAQQHLGEILAAAEWMNGTCMNMVQHYLPTRISEIVCDTPDASHFHYLLLETHGSSVEHDASKMEEFLQNVLIADGYSATSTQKQERFWQLRESANPAAAAAGYTYKYDISFGDAAQFDDFDAELRKILAIDKFDNILVPLWGHILDGNLHFNVTTPQNFQGEPRLRSVLDEAVLDSVQRLGGSVSAEHGIGQSKLKFMKRIHDPIVLTLMQGLKQVWDPKGILNPGKVVPAL